MAAARSLWAGQMWPPEGLRARHWQWEEEPPHETFTVSHTP